MSRKATDVLLTTRASVGGVLEATMMACSLMNVVSAPQFVAQGDPYCGYSEYIVYFFSTVPGSIELVENVINGTSPPANDASSYVVAAGEVGV